MRGIAWAIAVAAPLTACDMAGSRPIAGPYRLQPVEQHTQMIVVYDQGGGNYISRVEESVFAVGADDRYVVAARHPHEPGYSPLDRSVTEYFYIDRARDQALADPSLAVVGPMDAASFQAASRKLGLPKLSREIASLK